MLLHIFSCLCDLPGYSCILSLFTRRIYRKRFRVTIGLCFDMQTYPRLRPCMRFLFVRSEFCPSGDLLTPKIRLSSDSASRRTPLPLANPSHYRADSGLPPYRTHAHQVHCEMGLDHFLCYSPLFVRKTVVDRHFLSGLVADLYNKVGSFHFGFYDNGIAVLVVVFLTNNLSIPEKFCNFGDFHVNTFKI